MDENGGEWTGNVVDISKYGTSFVLDKDPPILRVGQTLGNFRLVIGTELVFEGKATTINLRKENDGLVVGISFQQNQVDLDKILYLGKESSLQQETIRNVISYQVSGKIDSAFKSEIADLRYFLENLKAGFERSEIQIKMEPGNKQEKLERCIIDSAGKHAYSIIHTSMKRISRVVTGFDKDLDDLHKDYFRRQLQELFLMDPFVNRSYKKPLGFAGDFEMMNILYRDCYEGETLFGKFLNNYSRRLPAAQAVRNRAPYMVNKIQNVFKGTLLKKGRHIPMITSVGCGPAMEIQNFLSSSDTKRECEINLIDSDKNALLYCQDQILEIKASVRHKARIKFLHKSIVEIFKEDGEVLVKRGQDLIYAIGVFDYLSTDVAKKLIRVLYELLSPNGILIVGNFDPINETRNYMDYAMDWYLIYRNGKEMMDLSTNLPPSSKSKIEKDPSGVNNFLVIKKR